MSMQPAETCGLFHMARPLDQLPELTAFVKQDPIVQASFPLGRAWFVAFASPVAMRWNGVCFPAERAIEELSFECYVPREVRKVPYRGRRIERIRPLLGAYILVKFDREADDWGQIRPPDGEGYGGIEGVHGIIRDAFGLPVRVPDVQVERLQRAEGAGAFDFTAGKPALVPGDEVEIMEGPFQGFIAKIRSASPQKRIKLIMGTLGDLQIEPSFLRKV